MGEERIELSLLAKHDFESCASTSSAIRPQLFNYLLNSIRTKIILKQKMFITLYKKCLDLAAHKSSKYYLAFISFIESSFFPIPPDVMVIPMVIAKKNDFIKIFLIATFFSVLGGIFGYLIGLFFFDVGIQIMDFYGYEDKVTYLKTNLTHGSGFYAWLGILFLAGFTPLPYKVFTIVSGLISFNLPIFIFISLISRGLRFFIVSYLSYKFGDLFTQFMNQHGSKWFTIIGLLIIIIALILLIIFKYNV